MESKQKKRAAKVSAPLSGIKVLELASVLAGPSVGMFLAELGAEVIKVENPLTGGDITRQWKVQSEKGTDSSAYFRSVNQYKKHLFLDLSSKNSGIIIERLLKKADILLVNFKPGDEKKWGFQPDLILKKYPKIIYGHITGYGPKNKKAAFDLCLQAESGFMSMNGTKASGPLKMPIAMIDILAAHHLKEGILTALYTRAKTGKGTYVHVSLFDASIVSLSYLAANFFSDHQVPKLIGSLHPNIAPYGETFQLKDASTLVLAIGTDHQFELLVNKIGLKDLSTHKKYRTNTDRVRNRKQLFPLLNSALRQLSRKEFEQLTKGCSIPYAFVNALDEALNLPAAKKLRIRSTPTDVLKSVIFSH